MAQFNVPSQPSRSTVTVSTFLGVDYTNNPGNVKDGQSPNGENMIRDVPGKVRKCMGYELMYQFPGKINGYHKRKQDDTGIVHAGTSLYKIPAEGESVGDPLYSVANNALSKSWQFDDKLYIIDGKAILVYDGETVKPVSEVAKIPLLTIAKEPQGGGTDYEALNLLQPKFSERFAGNGTDKVYNLSFSGLDETPVEVKIMTSAGTWENKTEGQDFTVNREAGQVTFNTAPAKSPVTGEDNVEITAARTVEGYADRINKCDIGILFGVNGASDRIFISGNPDYPNYDWYSGQYDPTYWPDTGYSVLGTGASAIMGYSIINNYLAAHKDDMDPDRNVIIRQGNLVDSTPAFPIINTLQGPGAVSKNSFAYLSTEPVFLTGLGVYAITPSDINGERYSQDRSYYLNGKMLNEPGLDKSVAVVYKDLYWLFANGVAYILDGLQSLGVAQNEPYSNRQYAGFYRTNVPASYAWVDKDGQTETLWFGTSDGDVFRFFSDPVSLDSYNDNGAPIHCVWETPDLSGKQFYKNKSFRYLAVRLASAVATSIKMYGQKRGIWSLLKYDSSKARYFSYGQLVYSKFTYSNDQTSKTIRMKTNIKKVDKARFRFENDELNEPFGLMDFAVEFVESGYFKG